MLENITDIKKIRRIGKIKLAFHKNGLLIFGKNVISLDKCIFWCCPNCIFRLIGKIYCFSESTMWLIKNSEIVKERPIKYFSNSNLKFFTKYKCLIFYNKNFIIIIDKDFNLVFNEKYNDVKLILNGIFHADDKIIEIYKVINNKKWISEKKNHCSIM